jgi:hypothetical protein
MYMYLDARIQSDNLSTSAFILHDNRLAKFDPYRVWTTLIRAAFSADLTLIEEPVC